MRGKKREMRLIGSGFQSGSTPLFSTLPHYSSDFYSCFRAGTMTVERKWDKSRRRRKLFSSLVAVEVSLLAH
jgi:hypothetical protein